MNTLLIDTHSSDIKVALLKDNESIRISTMHTSQASEATMPLIIEVLECAKLNIRDVNSIIVVNGPGSFTGVRIGVTIAKTIAYLLNIEIKTISSLDILKLSINECDNQIVAVPDSKGYYFNDINTNEIKYLNNNQFKEYITFNNLNVIEEDLIELDYEKIMEYSLNLETQNPHKVNPIYIKEIDALK